jgi:hypothetical protein
MPGKGSLGSNVLVRTESGLVRAQDLQVGDVILSLDIPGVPQNFTLSGTTAEDLAAVSLDPEIIKSATPALTTINSISINERRGAVSVNTEMFTRAHYLLIQRDGLSKVVTAAELVNTDKVFNYTSFDFVDITELEFLDIAFYAYSINCEPFDFFWTEHSLTFDNIEWNPDQV